MAIGFGVAARLTRPPAPAVSQTQQFLSAHRATQLPRSSARLALPSRKTPSRGAQNLTGQRHHAVGTKVHRATQANVNLRGQFQARDPRFVTQAKDLPSHRGYQTWHRELDAEVVKWIERHPQATPIQFEVFLRQRYSQPDLLHRFPNGLGGPE